MSWCAQHQLLPQPDGFEGLLAVDEDSNAPDPPLGEVVDVRGIGGNANATDSPGSGHTQEGEDAVRADRLQALAVDPEVETRLLDVGEEPPNASRAFVNPPTAAHGVRNSMSSVQHAR